MTEMASYEDIKYFFWIESVLVPLFFVLYIKGVPDQLSREQEKEQKKAMNKRKDFRANKRRIDQVIYYKSTSGSKESEERKSSADSSTNR